MATRVENERTRNSAQIKTKDKALRRNSVSESPGSNFDHDPEHGFFHETYSTSFSDRDHHDMPGTGKHGGPIHGRFAPEDRSKDQNDNGRESEDVKEEK